jgi:sugar lactone lactonase YvrE
MGRAVALLGSLLLALTVSPPAHAITAVSVDGRTAPITLAVGDAVTIRFDVAKAGGSVQARWARDLTGTGNYDPALPISSNTPTLTDGGAGDLDPAPGKIAWNFTVEPTMPAGRYILHFLDAADGSQVGLSGWTVVPKSQPQAISGRVVLGSGSTAPGSPPADAVIWAYTDLNALPTASANIGTDGRYTLPVPPGTYILFSEWFGNLRSQRQVVTVAGGQQAGPVNHELLVGQEISGSLRDDAGKPLPNTAVTASPVSGTPITTQSLADGAYVLVLPEGKWRISSRGMEKVVTVADQPLDGVDFPPPPTGPPPTAGTILTIAGNGFTGLAGDGGPATAARLPGTVGLAIDRAGNLYLVDNLVSRVRKIDAATGIITTVAGSTLIDAIRFLFPFPTVGFSLGGFSGDGGPATAATLSGPQHLAVDGAGNLYISDNGNQRIRRVDAKTGIITTVAGSGPFGVGKGSYSGDGGPATAATLFSPQGIAVDGAGNLYIADGRNNRVRKISPDGIITTVAGGGKNPVTEGADAISVALGVQRNVALDGQGNLLFWDNSQNRVLKIGPDGKLRFYAGNGTPGFSGDGGPATAAQLSAAFLGMAVDSAGNLFLLDSNNYRVRKVSPDGIITTVAGSGPVAPEPGAFSGDGGPATSARLSNPLNGIAIDGAGNLSFTDRGVNRVRKLIGVAAPGLIAGQ